MPKEKKVKNDKVKKKKFPVGLVILFVIIAAFAGMMVFINHDRHSEVSTYRGTIVDGSYCFYNESKDQIVTFSLSKGPHVVDNGDIEFAALKSKLKPANTSADRSMYSDEVAKAMGASFSVTSYNYIDENDSMVLFSYPYNGRSALWLYAEKRGTVSVVISDPDVKGIAYGNGIIYARNNARNETLCYRVSTSYSGDLLSVDPVSTVTSSPISFWYMTMVDLFKGVIKGFEASRATR